MNRRTFLSRALSALAALPLMGCLKSPDPIRDYVTLEPVMKTGGGRYRPWVESDGMRALKLWRASEPM